MLLLAIIIYVLGIITMMILFALFEMEISRATKSSYDDNDISTFRKRMWKNIRTDIPMSFVAGCLWPYFLTRIIIDFIKIQLKRK